jgi:hypothetical protein
LQQEILVLIELIGCIEMNKLGPLPTLSSVAAPASTSSGGLSSLGSLAPLSRPGANSFKSSNIANTSLASNSTNPQNKRRIKAIRFALKYSPPALALCYADQKYASKQRFKRMPLSDITDQSTAEECTQRLIKQHPAYLSPHILSQLQLQRLVSKLLSVHRANQKAASASDNSLDALYGNDDAAADEDLNRVDESVLQAKKSEMNVNFAARQLKPGDPGYQYDKRVEFQGQIMRSTHITSQDSI